jgi:hypothetical protein
MKVAKFMETDSYQQVPTLLTTVYLTLLSILDEHEQTCQG